MAGFLLHVGAPVQCSHGGQAQSPSPNPRVKVSGQSIVTQTPPFTVTGCPFTTPAGNPLPCVTGNWLTAAVRVRASNLAVLLRDSQALTVPNSVPLNVPSTQTRVKGT
jgi:hypothetical protein